MAWIEQASLVDAVTLAKLSLHVHRLRVEHAPHFCFEPTDVECQAALSELLSRRNLRAFIAYSDDRSADYVLARIREWLTANTFNPDQRWSCVDQFSGEPEWEGRGIGRRLMAGLVEYTRYAGIDELETDALACNNQTQAFFKAFGLKPKIE